MDIKANGKKSSIILLFFIISLCLLGSNFSATTRASKIAEFNISTKNIAKDYSIVEIASKTLPIGLPVITDAPGGIGNQLFEFACAYATAKKRNSDIYVLLPMKNFSEKALEYSPLKRDFVLDHFAINFSGTVRENFSSYGSGQIFDFKEQHIWENSLPNDTVLRVDAVCVSEVYFKEYREEIKKMFSLKIDESPIKDLLERIAKSESVGVHVRRGDYLYPQDNRTLPISFQKRAMKVLEKILPNATFFVFSDDWDFIWKEFHDYENVVLVDNSNEKMASLYDFLLMSRCKHNIIANSTFSWWAAYLNRNKDKIVIAPFPRHPPGWNEWFYKDKTILKYRELVLNYYLYPSEWLTLNPFEY